jgi:hypothetical protein
MVTSDLLPYGWANFDQQIVSSISARPEGALDTDMSGGMRCPLLGNDSWLSWAERKAGQGRKARYGTVWVGEPPLQFHASPTYLLQRPLDNFVAGRTLIGEALGDHWDTAATYRLGQEHSEDALTWNVFRSLQEAGELASMIHALTGIKAAGGEPALYLWGRHIALHGTSAWPALENARVQVEPWRGQRTEHDCCLHLPGQAWVFFATKFGSPTATKNSAPATDAWFDRYGRTCPGIFRRNAILATPPGQFPAQLLRKVALAVRVRQGREEVIVIALVRQDDASSVDVVAHRCLSDGLDAKFRMATWEQIYFALPRRRPLDRLRRYFEHKSYRLRPAFSLQRHASAN